MHFHGSRGGREGGRGGFGTLHSARFNDIPFVPITGLSASRALTRYDLGYDIRCSNITGNIVRGNTAVGWLVDLAMSVEYRYIHTYIPVEGNPSAVLLFAIVPSGGGGGALCYDA